MRLGRRVGLLDDSDTNEARHRGFPRQHIQEELSVAYVQAVAASAGAVFSPHRRDYGIDGSFRRALWTGQRLFPTGFPIDCQLKASTRVEVNDEAVKYDLEALAYNAIVERNSGRGTPILLIVLHMPSDDVNWLTVSEQALTLQHCCYWQLLTGAETTNRSTQRVEIPRQNLLTPSALTDLLTRQEQEKLR